MDPLKLVSLNRPVPRYTSYPTAPEWKPISQKTYREKLDQCDEASLYIHIPFCHSMCLYCGCSVVLNRKPEREAQYVDALSKEIDLIDRHLSVPQLHFGGGTPTKLSIDLLTRIVEKLHSRFSIQGEMAMEIDPRSVDAKKLSLIKDLGFNRISFGVQDTDPKVQKAVRRHQSRKLTLLTYNTARTLGFEHINIDLIYGLPYQTEKSFHNTISDIIAMRPNRIALFSYAKVPWLKPHQKAIKDNTLPSTLDKFTIYVQARTRLQEAGYIAIGMDHFAVADDPITQKRHRNFQGYTINPSPNLIGLGITAIGEVGNAYFQNVKTLDDYYNCLANHTLPTAKGHVLTQEDLMRRWVIHRLMCDFSLDKQEFEEIFQKNFDDTFAPELFELKDSELITLEPDRLIATPYGELFIRIVASTFDTYFQHKRKTCFSAAI